MQNHKISFSFGKNWQGFVENSFTLERLEIARQHIAEFLEVSDLQGKYFLDIGCGSGLSSLAAHQLGAAKIVSFDADPSSVQATEALKNSLETSDHWEVAQASILDATYIHGLDKADIVYSWGVLHHTGKMWEALKNAASLLSDTGVFYISIYVTTPKSDYWTHVKEVYNKASNFGKRRMELHYLLRYTFLPRLLRFQKSFPRNSRIQEKAGDGFHDRRSGLAWRLSL